MIKEYFVHADITKTIASCQPKFIKKGHVNKIFNVHEIKTDVKCTDIHDRQS